MTEKNKRVDMLFNLKGNKDVYGCVIVGRSLKDVLSNLMRTGGFDETAYPELNFNLENIESISFTVGDDVKGED